MPRSNDRPKAQFRGAASTFTASTERYVSPSTHIRSATHRDLRVSLAILAGIWIFAVIGLVIQDNLPKVVRVTAAIAAYIGISLLLANQWWRDDERSCPYPVLGVAGAVAGLLGSTVRPAMPPLSVIAIGIVAMSVVFAGIHWLALRSLARARERHSAGAPLTWR